MDFLVGENDIVLEELTQDNVNPTLSKKQLVPVKQGSSLYTLQIQCPRSLCFPYPFPLLIRICTYIHTHKNFRGVLGDTQLKPRNNGCFGNAQHSSNFVLRHQGMPLDPAQMLEKQDLHGQYLYLYPHSFTVVWPTRSLEVRCTKEVLVTDCCLVTWRSITNQAFWEKSFIFN